MGVDFSTTIGLDKNENSDNLETFSLLWLDAQVDSSRENQEAQKQLRNIINYLKTFDDESHCEQYISTFSPQDRVVLIVSGRLGQTIVPRIHHLRHIISIYVYCRDKQIHEQWSKHFTKVKAVTIRLDDLIAQIKQDQRTRIKVEEPLAFNIYAVGDNADQSTTGLNGHFVHSLLLIDVLLRMETKQTDKQELIALFYNEYNGNPVQFAAVREFEKKYSTSRALWWYTRESFLHKILNKALRTQNIDVLFLFGFVIKDIYQQLKQNQCQTFVRVYRGQVMSIEELDNLRQSIDNFISINSFFSTSMNRQKALGFLYQTDISNDLCRVLFEIEADSHVTSSKPYADISKFSCYRNEQEILFMIGCVFRLIDIQQSDDGEMWIIRMKLCGDDAYDLKKLFEHMKQDYGGGNDAVDSLAFGRVLRRMGKYELAEKFYRRLLHDVPSNDPSLSDLYYSLGVVVMDRGDYEYSLRWLHKSLDIIMCKNPSDYVNISSRYCCIGSAHWKRNDYNRALQWYNAGIQLFKQRNNSDHLSVAYFYNNIALVYDEQKKYRKALRFYQKALDIYEQHLPPEHPDIGTAHDNIGIVYRSLGQYDRAMKCHNQSLQIRQRSLPSHHTLIAFNFKNIGLLYENMSELTQALNYLTEAATIYHRSLSLGHPDVQKIENDIKRVSRKLQ